ncbi:MAG: hypothetical protein IPL78_24330 [Chloroflexi bacterium]|nr:hypothetical protein [Chloroflexota bacterium]
MRLFCARIIGCYIWPGLSAFHAGMMEEDEVEPPVPPGLQKLTPALRRFMEAFHVDESQVFLII